MNRFTVGLALAVGVWLSQQAKIQAGPVVFPGAVTVTDDNDPLGNYFSGTVTPSLSGPVAFDNGLLTITESIVPESSTAAWAVFHINSTNGLPLVGNPSGNADIQISGITTANSALTKFFTGYDVNGVDDPFPFPTVTIGPNPITGTGSVGNGSVSPYDYNYTTSQYLFADIDPFNQGPVYFGNSPSNTPTGFTIGGLYALQTVPEPGSLALAGAALAGVAVRSWRRRYAR